MRTSQSASSFVGIVSINEFRCLLDTLIDIDTKMQAILLDGA
jgi:hypothetical protein